MFNRKILAALLSFSVLLPMCCNSECCEPSCNTEVIEHDNGKNSHLKTNQADKMLQNTETENDSMENHEVDNRIARRDARRLRLRSLNLYNVIQDDKNKLKNSEYANNPTDLEQNVNINDQRTMNEVNNNVYSYIEEYSGLLCDDRKKLCENFSYTNIDCISDINTDSGSNSSKKSVSSNSF